MMMLIRLNCIILVILFVGGKSIGGTGGGDESQRNYRTGTQRQIQNRHAKPTKTVQEILELIGRRGKVTFKPRPLTSKGDAVSTRPNDGARWDKDTSGRVGRILYDDYSDYIPTDFEETEPDPQNRTDLGETESVPQNQTDLEETEPDPDPQNQTDLKKAYHQNRRVFEVISVLLGLLVAY